jgi:tRNA A-37 threonylcarbamoyl transferase component Bud32
VEHVIAYSPYVDQTPVGALLTALSEIPYLMGGLGPFLLLLSAVVIFLTLFPKFAIVSLFLLIAVFGMTWIATSVLTSDCKLKADFSGMTFPLSHLVAMKGELDRHWSELHDITFVRNELPSFDPETILFRFKDGAQASFRIDGFTRADFERLLLAINTYCPKVKTRPELSNLSSGVFSAALTAGMGRQSEDGGTGRSALSFTELWQAELGTRFGSTAFIPHESGDRLRDGELRIIGQVAFGGLSAVYLAERKGEQTVILKEAVLPESADDAVREKCLSMFQREAQMLARIDHPRIASVFDYFVEDGRHYLVLEHIEGRNLRTHLRECGPQGEVSVLTWAIEIAGVLIYLHGLSPPVIHRDLTPDNMIIGKDGSITIVDFGAANDFLGTATGTVVGKNAYIPLEQFRGKANPKSDIYAFGATLYFLVTGEDPEPFSQKSPAQSGAELSSELDRLIGDCLKLDQSLRLDSASSLLARLKCIRESHVGGGV